MTTPFRVLIIGDSSTDKPLIERQLCLRWPALVLLQVGSVEALQTALNKQSWDCVLCDPCIPGLNALKALSVSKNTTYKLPFIILSDIVNFESATTLLKNGADDFVDRHKLERLNPVIDKALEDVESTHKAAHELRDSEQRLRQAQWRALIDTLPDLVWLKDRQGVYLACNHRYERFLGVSEEEIIGKTDYDFIDKSQADSFHEQDQKAMTTGKRCISEERICFADDGHIEELETIKVPMFQPDGTLMGVLGVGRDITQRKLHDELMLVQTRRAEAMQKLSLVAEKKDENAFIKAGLDLVEDLTYSCISFLHFYVTQESSTGFTVWSERTLEEYFEADGDEHHLINPEGICAEAQRQLVTVIDRKSVV